MKPEPITYYYVTDSYPYEEPTLVSFQLTPRKDGSAKAEGRFSFLDYATIIPQPRVDRLPTTPEDAVDRYKERCRVNAITLARKAEEAQDAYGDSLTREYPVKDLRRTR